MYRGERIRVVYIPRCKCMYVFKSKVITPRKPRAEIRGFIQQLFFLRMADFDPTSDVFLLVERAFARVIFFLLDGFCFGLGIVLRVERCVSILLLLIWFRQNQRIPPTKNVPNPGGKGRGGNIRYIPESVCPSLCSPSLSTHLSFLPPPHLTARGA